MKNKILLIKQPAGLGDILYCLKIAKIIQNETEYKKVIWPVDKNYLYLSDYIEDDTIFFPNENEEFEYKNVYLSDNKNILKTENYLYVPLQSSDSLIKNCYCHNSSIAHGHIKYNFCGIDYLDWKSYFSIKRNYERENELIKKIKLNISEPYNIINRNYGTYPNYITADLGYPKNNYNNVFMEFYDNTTIFDWMKILENAEEIHTIETSLCYIIEKMNIEKNVFIYSKYKSKNSSYEDDYSYMKSHCSKKWNFV